MALRKHRLDLTLTAVIGLAVCATCADAILAAHSLPYRIASGTVAALAVMGAVAQGALAVKDRARTDEEVGGLRETVAYLERPEIERNLETMFARWSGEQAADALFREDFDYWGESTDTTTACRLCAWRTNGTLASVRSDAVAHGREAHAVAA